MILWIDAQLSPALARWISDELIAALLERGADISRLRAVEVEVEESFGQRAFCRRERGACFSPRSWPR